MNITNPLANLTSSVYSKRECINMKVLFSEDVHCMYVVGLKYRASQHTSATIEPEFRGQLG